ncbi:unnamed protein product [Ixodes persulcatus]
MLKGWFDAFRTEGGPTLYAASNRTAVTEDIRNIIIYVSFSTLFLAFLIVFPGIRKECLAFSVAGPVPGAASPAGRLRPSGCPRATPLGSGSHTRSSRPHARPCGSRNLDRFPSECSSRVPSRRDLAPPAGRPRFPRCSGGKKLRAPLDRLGAFTGRPRRRDRSGSGQTRDATLGDEPEELPPAVGVRRPCLR